MQTVLTNRSFRENYGRLGPVLFWLNLQSKAEVDELHAEWKAAQAKVVAEPEDKPWKLHEFLAADLDGNLIRVFYDFGTTESTTTFSAQNCGHDPLQDHPQPTPDLTLSPYDEAAFPEFRVVFADPATARLPRPLLLDEKEVPQPSSIEGSNRKREAREQS